MKKLLSVAILTGIMVFGWNYSFLFTNFYTNAQLATSSSDTVDQAEKTDATIESKTDTTTVDSPVSITPTRDTEVKEEKEEAVIAPGLIYVPEESEADTPIVYDLSSLTPEQQIKVKTDLVEQGYTRAGDVPQDALDQAIIDAVSDGSIDDQNDDIVIVTQADEQEQQIIEQAIIEEKREAYLRTFDEDVYESTEVVQDSPSPDLIVYGCMNQNACNYNPAAQRSDRSCTYCGSKQICTTEQSCCEDPDENGECGDQRLGGCTNRNACNYDFGVDFDDGSCVLPIGCDWSRCPNDGGVVPIYDQCGICGGNGICEDNTQEPFKEEEFYGESAEQEQLEAYNSEQYEELYPDGVQNEQEDSEKTIEHGIAPEKVSPVKIPFSISLSDDATLGFRFCLSEERDHTVCVYEQLNYPDNDVCKNTLSGYSLGTRIVLTNIKKHTCEAIKEEIIEQEDPEKTTIVIVPENPPEEIVYKNNELFVDAIGQEELQGIIHLLDEMNVSVLETEQPFINAGIDTIYLLKVSYEKDSATTEMLLEEIYENRAVEETVTAVPIFKIAQQEDQSLEEIVKNILPYYLEQTKREEFIDQCGMPKKKVKIAVIDNAFDTSHEDLQKNIAYAYDVADDDFDTSPPTDGDTARNHGNIASGIIGATADNEIGILGVANDAVELYLFKATTDQANGEDITAGIEAIAQAIEQGVDIINISRGAYINHPVVRKIIKQAQKKGIIIVAAAGNYSDSEPFYPAAYKNVVGVGALNEDSERAEFSNFGERVNKTMYGTNIASTDLDNTYDIYNGTSEASPLYAGILGLGISYGFAQEQIDAIDREQGNSLLQLATYCEKENPDAELIEEESNDIQENSHSSAPLTIPGDIPGLDVVNGHIGTITSYVENNYNTVTILLLGSLLLNTLFFITLLSKGKGQKQLTQQES